MKVRNLTIGLLGACAAAALAGASHASVLYDDGPLNGTIDAWTINFGYQVSDSFTLTKTSTLTGVNFGVWSFPGDTFNTVDWSIGTAAYGSASSGTGSVTNGAQTTNGFGYQIATDSFSLPNITLGPGTYFLTLQNAAVNTGDPIYWDQNNGPSQAFENSVGDLNQYPGGGAEAFQILGNTGAVPEPATWTIMLMGVGLLGGALRTSRKAQAGAVAA